MASNPHRDFEERLVETGGIKNTYKSGGGTERNIHKAPNGRRGFTSDDGTLYYEDPDNPGKFVSSTRVHDYVNLGAIEQAAAAPAVAAPTMLPEAAPDLVEGEVGMTEDKGMTTEEIMGDTYETMVDWRPTTPGQVVNPLVNASNWLTELDPDDQEYYNPGTFVNPQIQQMQGMLQAPQTSRNPYSLLG